MKDHELVAVPADVYDAALRVIISPEKYTTEDVERIREWAGMPSSTAWSVARSILISASERGVARVCAG